MERIRSEKEISGNNFSKLNLDSNADFNSAHQTFGVLLHCLSKSFGFH